MEKQCVPASETTTQLQANKTCKFNKSLGKQVSQSFNYLIAVQISLTSKRFLARYKCTSLPQVAIHIFDLEHSCTSPFVTFQMAEKIFK